jgi:hypothetical protein
MIPFLISLMLATVNNEYFIFSLYISFILGIFQIFAALSSLFVMKDVSAKKRKEVMFYLLSVFLYFFVGFIILSYFNEVFNISFLTILSIAAPIILSIFWTYILESIKEQL